MIRLPAKSRFLHLHGQSNDTDEVHRDARRRHVCRYVLEYPDFN